MKDVYAACDAAYFGYDDLFNPEADTRAYVAQQVNFVGIFSFGLVTACKGCKCFAIKQRKYRSNFCF